MDTLYIETSILSYGCIVPKKPGNSGGGHFALTTGGMMTMLATDIASVGARLLTRMMHGRCDMVNRRQASLYLADVPHIESLRHRFNPIHARLIPVSRSD